MNIGGDGTVGPLALTLVILVFGISVMGSLSKLIKKLIFSVTSVAFFIFAAFVLVKLAG